MGLGSHSLETSFLAPPAEASTIDIALTTSHWERKGFAPRRKEREPRLQFEIYHEKRQRDTRTLTKVWYRVDDGW
jgi:hypothetical protein